MQYVCILGYKTRGFQGYYHKKYEINPAPGDPQLYVSDKMKVTIRNINLNFPFEKYCKLFFAVPPAKDLVGIREIRFLDTYSHSKTDRDALGCYLQGSNGRNAVIEIHLPNILKGKIHEFSFINYPEVAALLLSQVVFHQFGHHVHKFKRYGLKKEKRDIFAAKYTAACYYRYLSSRKAKILADYKRASDNIHEIDEEGRYGALISQNEIIGWLEEHKEGVPFP
jgi:hypothetical protein